MKPPFLTPRAGGRLVRPWSAWWFCVPGISFSNRPGLTTPSRGPAFGRPLTSNVSPQQGRSMSRWLVCPSSVVRANTNASVGQRRSQQASPAARVSTVALNCCLRSTRIRRVGQARASLAHPTPLLLSAVARGFHRRQVGQIHCSSGLRRHWSRKEAFGKATFAGLLAGQWLSSGSRGLSEFLCVRRLGELAVG